MQCSPVQPIQPIFHFLCDILCPHTVLCINQTSDRSPNVGLEITLNLYVKKEDEFYSPNVIVSILFRRVTKRRSGKKCDVAMPNDLPVCDLREGGGGEMSSPVKYARGSFALSFVRSSG